MKTSQTLIALAVSGLLLAGCAPAPYQVRGPDSDPNQEGTYRGPDQAPVPPGQAPANEPGMNRTQRNALIGAGVGAVVGLLSGSDATERRQRALVGAGVGALTGGAVGHYQDKQERAMRERLAGSGVEVVRQGDNITLDLPHGVTFAFDSANLRPEFHGTLDRVAETLREYGQTIIEIAGHTDSVGSEQYNQSLSERRARAVADYLVARGVSRDRLIIVGAGETRPVASNETEAGRAENRRVEVTVVPLRSQ